VGLGLVISKKIIQMMGGELEVTSTPGIGSCFYFNVHLRTAKSFHSPSSSPEKSGFVANENSVVRVPGSSRIRQLSYTGQLDVTSLPMTQPLTMDSHIQSLRVLIVDDNKYSSI
jgi:hypothetical protein